VRRLFSTFARGWPGVGLLLIRIVAGVAFIQDGSQKLQGDHAIGTLLIGLTAIGDGALLLVGLWTPIAGCVVIAVTAWGGFVLHDPPYPSLLLATMGAALVLLGPGAVSVDARLFGWKRIDV